MQSIEMPKASGRSWVFTGMTVAVVAAVALGISIGRTGGVSGVKLVGSTVPATKASAHVSTSSAEDADSSDTSSADDSGTDESQADITYAQQIGKQQADEGIWANFPSLPEQCQGQFNNISRGSARNDAMPDYTGAAFVTACVAELKARGMTGTDPDPFDDGRGYVNGNPYQQQPFTAPEAVAHGSATPDRSSQEEPGTGQGSATPDRSGEEEPGTGLGSATPDRSGEEEPGTGVGAADPSEGDDGGSQDPPAASSDDGGQDSAPSSDDQGEESAPPVVG